MTNTPHVKRPRVPVARACDSARVRSRNVRSYALAFAKQLAIEASIQILEREYKQVYGALGRELSIAKAETQSKREHLTGGQLGVASRLHLSIREVYDNIVGTPYTPKNGG